MENISRLLILSCLLLSCTIMSCDKKESDCIKVIAFEGCGQPLIPFDVDEYNDLVTDSVSVVGVRLENTCLMVDFSYSGCAQRETNVMTFLDNSSFIPLINAKINNIDPQEACLALFTHTDTFDLSTSNFELHDGLLLRVHDWSESFVLDIE